MGAAFVGAVAVLAVLASSASAAVATPDCEAPYGTLSSTPATASLTFGIYPGGYAGGGTEPAVPDNPMKIQRALNELQGEQDEFLVRAYVEYHDNASDGDPAEADPANFTHYLRHGRRLDLVIEYSAETGNLEGWKKFVRKEVRRYGTRAATISVSLEPNLENSEVGRQALIVGLPVAAHVAARLEGPPPQIGFDAVNFGVPFDTEFWEELASEAPPAFYRALDYVGTDLYAGAFGEVAPEGEPGDREDVITEALMMVRNCSLPLGGIDESVPLRVTENGWPVADGRTEAQQAEVFETVIETINALRGPLDIQGYEAFALRDDTTSSEELFDHFGLMRDDYSKKPAFEVFQQLIAALG